MGFFCLELMIPVMAGLIVCTFHTFFEKFIFKEFKYKFQCLLVVWMALSTSKTSVPKNIVGVTNDGVDT